MAAVIDDQFSVGIESGRVRVKFNTLGALPATYVKRLGLKDWDDRDDRKTRLSNASLVVDVSNLLDRESGELHHDSAQVENLFIQGLVPAYFVIGHAKADGRPLCVRVGDQTNPLIPADLPLVPLKR